MLWLQAAAIDPNRVDKTRNVSQDRAVRVNRPYQSIREIVAHGNDRA